MTEKPVFVSEWVGTDEYIRAWGLDDRRAKSARIEIDGLRKFTQDYMEGIVRQLAMADLTQTDTLCRLIQDAQRIVEHADSQRPRLPTEGE